MARPVLARVGLGELREYDPNRGVVEILRLAEGSSSAVGRSAVLPILTPAELREALHDRRTTFQDSTEWARWLGSWLAGLAGPGDVRARDGEDRR